MFAYFDIETDGLDQRQCAFKCGVVHIDGMMHTFTDAVAMATFLVEARARATIVSFNGLSFDFQVLAHKCEPALQRQVAALAISEQHVDIMFAFAGAHGYYASMQSFAESLGLSKTWDGAAAAASDDVDAIIAYCKQDVRVLQKVHEAALQNGFLARKTKAGRPVKWVLTAGMGPQNTACVIANLRTFKPDQRWMTNPPVLPDALSGWTTALLPSAGTPP